MTVILITGGFGAALVAFTYLVVSAQERRQARAGRHTR